LVGQQERHPARKKWGMWRRWALVSSDGMAPSRMVGVSASVNLPLHHKGQRFSSGTGSLGWSRKKGRKMIAVLLVILMVPFSWCFSICFVIMMHIMAIKYGCGVVVVVVASSFSYFELHFCGCC